MKTMVAVAQMCSGKNKAENLERCTWLAGQAQKRGASLLALPENCTFLGEEDHEAYTAAEALDGPTIKSLAQLAKLHGLWISLGGFQERLPGQSKIANTHVLINSDGAVVATYRKIHLFSVTLPDGSVYDEARAVQPGSEICSVTTPFGRVGLSICYDLRFPLLYQALRSQGAQILMVPAAFSAITGPAHWEPLLRARAIETQSYVLASAQFGRHNARRTTHGHAMIVDPWGSVLAQCSIESHLACAEISIPFVSRLREDMPVWHQRVIL